MRPSSFVVVLVGCGRIGFEPLGADGANGTNGSNGSNDVSCPAISQCPDKTSAAHLGMTLSTTQVARNHGLSSVKCGSGANNPELAVLFTVTDDATYTIDAPGQLVVYVQDTCCGGPELACGLAPYVIPRRAGDAFVVVVEASVGTPVTVEVTGN